MNRTFIPLLPAIVAALLLGACASQPPVPGAMAELQGRSGSKAQGRVQFTQLAHAVRIDVEARNVPAGEHGFHIHEVGDCRAPDASSAKGHYNPAGAKHGHAGHGEHHAGDIPNLTADSAGVVRYSVDLRGVTLKDIIGRSVVVHADPDDYTSQPAGNSGPRIACGVVAPL